MSVFTSGGTAAASGPHGQPVRVAVAGAGMIVLEEPEAMLVAIVDPSPASRAQAAALGVAWLPDLETLFAGDSPDGVVIATPNQLHVPHGLAAVAAGVPILLEKPFSTDVESGMHLVTAAEAAGVPILVGHHRRHSPLIQRARAAVESGRLGRIVAVNGLCWLRKPSTGYFDGAFTWRCQPGGGVVLINLIHVIDDLRNICGDIVAVQAAESSAVRGFAVEDTAAIIRHFANGALGTLAISDATTAPWGWELTSGENKAYPRTDQPCYLIAGTEGSLSVPRLDLWTHEGDGWMTPIRTDGAHSGAGAGPANVASAAFLSGCSWRGFATIGRPGRRPHPGNHTGGQDGGRERWDRAVELVHAASRLAEMARRCICQMSCCPCGFSMTHGTYGGCRVGLSRAAGSGEPWQCPSIPPRRKTNLTKRLIARSSS